MNGSTVVGKLCVSAFSEMTLSIGLVRKKSLVDWSAGANCSTTGPCAKATLSLYAESMRLGFSCVVFFIIWKSDDSISFPSMMNEPPKILWRQCSELICAKPNISESVSGRPSCPSILWRYSISSGERASPSCSLYSSRLSTCFMGSGSCFTVKMSWSMPSYIRCSIGSCSASLDATGKYSSIRRMPWRFMFCVISTAFVLHGVIISRLGPTKYPSSLSPSSSFASP